MPNAGEVGIYLGWLPPENPLPSPASMPLDELKRRAKREFKDYILVENDLEAQWSKEDGDITFTSTAKFIIVVAKHPLQQHDHVLLISEDMELVAQAALDIIESEMAEVNRRLCAQGKFNRVDEIQTDTRRNVFTKTVYAFTHVKPCNWSAAQRLYDEKEMSLKLRDDNYNSAYMSEFANDIFLCHSSDDKHDIARPLANALVQRGVLPWFDEISLEAGDSLIDKIDEALRKTKMGVIILSQSFLSKRGWTRREFKSLATKELLNGTKALIPVWHNVSAKEVGEYCLDLADKDALKTSDGLDKVADGIIQSLRAEEARRKRAETLES